MIRFLRLTDSREAEESEITGHMAVAAPFAAIAHGLALYYGHDFAL